MPDAPAPSGPVPSAVPPHTFRDAWRGEAGLELRKEAYTMGLYAAICLLGALIALPTNEKDEAKVIAIIWGVTVGVSLAHWFAFQVSASLVNDGRVPRSDVNAALAQLGGAVAVAVLASIPVLLVPAAAELEVAELTLGGFIGVVGFGVSRGSGASLVRSVIYAVVILVVAIVIAIIRNLLGGH